MASREKLAYSHHEHGFPPAVFPDSEILILGSFPSVKSREANFFYGHPKNRFWEVLSQIYGKSVGNTTESKLLFLKDIHIALYDVIESCDIIGSSDSSIKNVDLSDILKIIQNTKVRKILLNGKKAGNLFEKYQWPVLQGFPLIYEVLPSTSPANAAWKTEDLITSWKAALISIA